MKRLFHSEYLKNQTFVKTSANYHLELYAIHKNEFPIKKCVDREKKSCYIVIVKRFTPDNTG